ncbi:PorP/SprF family type IX secretion system membrane protein [Botryobacter ruber]|uniref:PorP/SprF family type IX secretion system membrane protein n=1 Tax=Botryobacter ruber TaxID=2171629 RepID=UPI000E0B450E|nr:PorP/SprF family type IX secretion system membrane protein [Botryobacter ruber]
MRDLFKNIVKKAFVLSLCGLGFSAYSQTSNPLTQYARLPILYNPAASGVENFTDVKIGTRYQWAGMDDSPKGYFLGVNHSFQNDETTGQTKVGLSGFVVQERVAGYRDLQAAVSSAVHIPVSGDTYLSLGFKAGINRISADLGELRVRGENDRVYQDLLASDGAVSYLDVNPGVMLHSSNFYIGYSPLQLIRARISDNFGEEDESVVRHVATAGYTFQVTDDWEVAPGALVQLQDKLDPTYLLTGKVRYRSMFWGGVGYSPNRSVSGMLGISPTSRLNISYSYDHSVGEANVFKFGSSHELIIGIPLFKQSDKAPMMW